MMEYLLTAHLVLVGTLWKYWNEVGWSLGLIKTLMQ